MRYVVRQDGDDLFVTPVQDGAQVAVGAGATLYPDWNAVLADYPDAEEPE